MIQTLNDFVESALSGDAQIPIAGRLGGKIVEYIGNLSAKDIDAIAAEAINRDIVDSSMSWDELIKQINSIISNTQQ